jgi:hypothetical protein
MKRSVSLVAFFLVAAAGPLALAGCSGAKAGKQEFAEACATHMGGQTSKCSCFVDSVEKELPPEVFASVAQGAHDNRRMSGMLPESVMSQPYVSDALANATQACFA